MEHFSSGNFGLSSKIKAYNNCLSINEDNQLTIHKLKPMNLPRYYIHYYFLNKIKQKLCCFYQVQFHQNTEFFGTSFWTFLKCKSVIPVGSMKFYLFWSNLYRSVLMLWSVSSVFSESISLCRQATLVWDLSRSCFSRWLSCGGKREGSTADCELRVIGYTSWPSRYHCELVDLLPQSRALILHGDVLVLLLYLVERHTKPRWSRLCWLIHFLFTIKLNCALWCPW